MFVKLPTTVDTYKTRDIKNFYTTKITDLYPTEYDYFPDAVIVDVTDPVYNSPFVKIKMVDSAYVGDTVKMYLTKVSGDLSTSVSIYYRKTAEDDWSPIKTNVSLNWNDAVISYNVVLPMFNDDTSIDILLKVLDIPINSFYEVTDAIVIKRRYIKDITVQQPVVGGINNIFPINWASDGIRTTSGYLYISETDLNTSVVSESLYTAVDGNRYTLGNNSDEYIKQRSFEPFVPLFKIINRGI